eukprot:UN21216
MSVNIQNMTPEQQLEYALKISMNDDIGIQKAINLSLKNSGKSEDDSLPNGWEKRVDARGRVLCGS